MTAERSSLMDKALDVQRRLEERGQTEDAQIIRQLIDELSAIRVAPERPYYTVTEAAKLIGVSGQTIKNWVSRGIIIGYRLGGRIVIPRTELDSYQSAAEALKAIEPLPPTREIIERIRAGRRPFSWPAEEEQQEQGQ